MAAGCWRLIRLLTIDRLFDLWHVRCPAAARGGEWSRKKRGRVTVDAYAAVAQTNPWGFVALRARGFKYVWVGLSLLVLVSM